jgi:hypothetical protein
VIISYRHRFIFLRTRKTAGSSISAVLNRSLGPRDIQVGGWSDAIAAGGHLNRYAMSTIVKHPGLLGRELWEEFRINKKPRLSSGSINRIVKYGFLSKYGFHGEHPRAVDARTVDPDAWETHFKFCVVRNPWDHAVSDYHWRTKDNQEVTFADFLGLMIDERKADPYGVRSPLRSNWAIYTINDEIQADMVLRYEDLASGLKEIGKQIGVQTDISAIFRKANFRPKASLKAYYNEENIEMVRYLYREEVETFGYKVPF